MTRLSPEIIAADDELIERLGRIKTWERDTGQPMFMGTPERWYEGGIAWRCPNGHVSRMALKSEQYGADLCLAAGCGFIVRATFPEDVEGPLTHPALETP